MPSFIMQNFYASMWFRYFFQCYNFTGQFVFQCKKQAKMTDFEFKIH